MNRERWTVENLFGAWWPWSDYSTTVANLVRDKMGLEIDVMEANGQIQVLKQVVATLEKSVAERDEIIKDLLEMNQEGFDDAGA